MTTWPGTLPQSLSGNGDYQEGTERVTIRTSMEYGFATKSRRARLRGEKPVSGSFILTGSQVDTFFTFYNTDLAGGSLQFDGQLTRVGSTETYKFSDEPLISHIGGDVFKLDVKLLVIPT